MENPALRAFVEPARYGFSTVAVHNLASLFATLILPYCYKGAPYERIIDFSEINSFDTVDPKEGRAPVPGQRQFIETLVKLIDDSKLGEAVVFYDRFREFQPASEHLEKIDPVLQQLRGRVG